MSPSQPNTPPKPSFFASPSFVISCACLALEESTHDILLTRQPHSSTPPGTTDNDNGKEHQGQSETAVRIPRGPKNVDEGLLSAAVRQTFEATGLWVEPLLVCVPTRAGGKTGVSVSVRIGGGGGVTVIHGGAANGSGSGSGGTGVVTEGRGSYEPFAVCEFTGGDGVREIVLYFLARVKRRGQATEAQGGRGGRDAVWASVGDVEGGVVGLGEEERMVLRTGVDLARKAGISMSGAMNGVPGRGGDGYRK